MMLPFVNLMNISDPAQLVDLDLDEFQNQTFHIYWKDREGKYLGCNNAQALAAGFEKGQDLLGATDFDFLQSDYAPVYRQNDLAIMSNDKPSTMIEPVTLVDGSSKIAMSYKTRLRSRTTTKVSGIIGISFLFNTDSALNSLVNNTQENKVHLTERQADCLYYAVKGMTMKKIANQLNLSPKTVEHYLYAIKVKLKCSCRAELIAKGLQLSCIKSRFLMGT